MRAPLLPFPVPMPRRLAALALFAALGLALAAPAARAQPDGALPDDPAAAAPNPPDLSRPPRPAQPLPQPSLPLARGIEALPTGGWRLTGTLAEGRADAAAQNALSGIGRWLAQTEGRVTIIAQVSGPEEDVSAAHRAALDHGRALRRLLEQAGLDGTRIDIRALGRTAEARDAIELLPPSARQTPSQPPSQTQSQTRP
ncbi:hypothetical protein [Pseudoroseomonas cervicalis]|uniref:hypothetical protein n=1 Tax=Teichococcus cervicalis TaxID=204525 RepID=UPI0022F1CFCB|nr:hypothetical protein [Pseudoroseomonas cervicalis]WBV42001.1 hypothetical protein PFY06_12210 [Pseudoroseomonas cervicalis]